MTKQILVEALLAALWALEHGQIDLDSCAATGTNQTLRELIHSAIVVAKGE